MGDPSTASPPNLPCLWSGATLSVEFLAAVIDHVGHPVFVKDREFRWVLLNNAISSLLGFDRAQMLGRTDYDFFPRAESDWFRAKDEEVFRNREAVAITEETITDAAGNRHILATTKVPLVNASGEVTHLVGIMKDITELKAAEGALRRAKQDCETLVAQTTAELSRAQKELVRKERLAVLGQLAAGVAHQIRNPLAVMTNVAALLRHAATTGSADAMRDALDALDDEVRQANQIVTDLLDYARVRPPTRRAVPIAYVIEHVLGAQQIPASVTIEKDLPPELNAWIDPDQVQTALYNLVRNAVEAMPSGGTLGIRASAQDDDVRVLIEDTGTGIPLDIQGQLFEPLVTSKTRGLGIGLTTARALLENQDGRIAWLNRPGPGTCFEIRLPRARS